MKGFITKLFTGRDNKFSGLIAFALVGIMILGCNCNKEGGFSFGEAKLPADAELQTMVQKSIQDFTASVESGDFGSFRATTSSDFQKEFTTEKLNETFAVFINKKALVAPVLRSTATMTPVYSPAPALGKQNSVQVLDVVGVYETSPVPTRFDLRYMQDGGQWKLIKIVIKLQ
jgi:hypothetical protein